MTEHDPASAPAPKPGPKLRLDYGPTAHGLPAYALAKLLARDALASIHRDNPRLPPALEAAERAFLEQRWPIYDLCVDAAAVAGGYMRPVAAALGVSDALLSAVATGVRVPSLVLHRQMVAYCAAGGQMAPEDLRKI